jgi:hypothetical protein
MNSLTLIETPPEDFPKSLSEEYLYVKSRLSEYPSYENALKIFEDANVSYATYNLEIHTASKLVYDNCSEKAIIRRVGENINTKYGFKGLQGICLMVPLVAAIQTRHRLVYAHLKSSINGTFDGIGEWKM